MYARFAIHNLQCLTLKVGFKYHYGVTFLITIAATNCHRPEATPPVISLPQILKLMSIPRQEPHIFCNSHQDHHANVVGAFFFFFFLNEAAQKSSCQQKRSGEGSPQCATSDPGSMSPTSRFYGQIHTCATCVRRAKSFASNHG